MRRAATDQCGEMTQRCRIEAGLVTECLHHLWHADVVGDAQRLIGEPAQRAFGLEAIRHLDRATHRQHRAHIGDQADGVKHRRFAQKAAARVHPRGDAKVVRRVLQILLTQHHPFG